MSDELELPELDEKGWTGKKCPECQGSGWVTGIGKCGECDGTGDEYSNEHCRKEQLRESLAQIAILTAQVEELQADLKRGLNVEFQRTTCCVCGVYKHTPVRNDDLGGYICGGCLERAYEKAEAELAALRAGKVVTYRGQNLIDGAWVNNDHGYYAGLAQEQIDAFRTSNAAKTNRLVEVTTITCERILDTTERP